MIDYTKWGVEIALDLINEANGTDYDLIDLTIEGVSELDEDEDGFNTSATLKPTYGSMYEGSINVKYNRVDIQSLLKSVSIVLKPFNGSFISDYLPDFNRRYGFNIDKDDIFDGYIPNNIKYPSRVLVKLRPGHPVFTGSFWITLSDTEYNIEHTVTNRLLDTSLYPTDDKDKIQGPLYFYGHDFTGVSNRLIGYIVGKTFIEKELDWLNTYSNDLWLNKDEEYTFNTRNASVIYNDVISEGNPYTNRTDYTHVCVIQLDPYYCSGVAGYLTFHYNYH